MKKLTLLKFFLVTGLLIIWQCSEDKSPTSTTDEENYQLVETVSIGTDGGSLENDEIILSVPDGAFAETMSISLYKSTDYYPFDAEAASSTYKLVGLPTDFSDTLKLRIKYDSTLAEESYIALGTSCFVRSHEGVQIGFKLFPATDSAGYLLCDIPEPEADISTKKIGAYKTSGAIWDWICATVTRKRTITSSGGHFAIRYPYRTVTAASVNTLAGFLEAAYTKFSDIGFIYTSRTDWPMSVTVKDMGATIYGGYTSTVWGKNGGYMEFNSREITNVNDIRSTAGHEFFHFVQELYDPRGAWDIAGGKNYKHYWLDEATAVWSEEYFTSNPNYRSIAFIDNEKEPFAGMHIAGDHANTQWHGYGMAPVIRDLYQRSVDGDLMILDIYQNIKDKQHPVQAILGIAGEPTYWWSFFFENYMIGTHYSIFGDNFVNSTPDTFKINEQFVEESITEAYQDISATMYVIELMRPDFGTSDLLELKAIGAGLHPEIVAFKYKPANWQLLGNQKDNLLIGDLAATVLDGWGLAAIVVNTGYTAPSYKEETDIEFEVKLMELPELDQNEFSFGYKIHAFWDTNYGSSWDKVDQTSQYCCFNDGSFNGYTFQASWDKDIYEGHTKGTFIATVNATIDKIVTFTVKDTTLKQYSGYPDNIYVTEISGADVPLDYHYEGSIYFRANNTDACNVMTSFTHFIAAATDTAWIVNKQCNDNSYLNLSFTKSP